MTWFLIGALVGACIGFIACALLVIGYTSSDDNEGSP